MLGGDIFESIPNVDAIFMKVCFEFEDDICFLTKNKRQNDELWKCNLVTQSYNKRHA